MKKPLWAASLAGVIALTVTTAYAYKEHCEWNITFFKMGGDRSVAVSYFEHPHQPDAVKAYVKKLRAAGTIVITQQDLVRGVRVPPLSEGKSLAIVFEQMPKNVINSHFPSPKTDMHIVQIDARNANDIVNSVNANYTTRELAAHPIRDPQLDVFVDAYIAHYQQLGGK